MLTHGGGGFAAERRSARSGSRLEKKASKLAAIISAEHLWPLASVPHSVSTALLRTLPEQDLRDSLSARDFFLWPASCRERHCRWHPCTLAKVDFHGDMGKALSRFEVYAVTASSSASKLGEQKQLSKGHTYCGLWRVHMSAPPPPARTGT